MSDDGESDDIDREAILARRTLLISAGLAGIGCALPDLPPHSWGPPPCPEPDLEREDPYQPMPPSAAWELVRAIAPPLEIPPELGIIDKDLPRSLTFMAEKDYDVIGWR